MYQQPDPVQMQHMAAAMVPVFLFFGLLSSVIFVVPFWMIFKKAGFTGALSLLMLLPLVNIVVLYVLAFSRWRVVPVPEYGMYPTPGYPPQPGYVPPSGYVPGAYPPPAGYSASAGYNPAAGTYPPAPGTPVAPPADPPV